MSRDSDIPARKLRQIVLTIRHRPGDIENWKEFGRQLAAAGVKPECIQVVGRLLKTLPDDLEALMRSSEYLHMAGRPKEALTLIDSALAASPESLAARRQRARVLEHIAANDGLRAWNEVLKAAPDDVEANFCSGKIALVAGKFNLGEARLRKAISSSSGTPRMVQNLFGHLLWSGRLLEARQLCKDAIRRWPAKADAWVPAIELLRLTSSKGASDRVMRYVANATSSIAEHRLFFADLLDAVGSTESARRLLRDLALDREVGAEATARLLRSVLRMGDLERAEGIARRSPSWTQSSLHNKVASELAAARTFILRFKQASRKGEAMLKDVFLDEVERIRRNPSDKIAPRPGVVLHIVHSLALGGTERQCVTVASAQARRGVPGQEIFVLRTDPGEHGRAVFFLENLLASGARSLPLTRFRHAAHANTGGVPLLDACDGVLADLFGSAEIAALVSAIREIRPSVVHAWTPQICAYGAIAAQITGVPKIVLRVGSVAPGVREFRTEKETQHFAWLRMALKAAMALPNIVLFSNCDANLVSWIKWLDVKRAAVESKVGLLPNVLDPLTNARPVTARERRAIRARYDLPTKMRVIGTVTRFEREKGIDLWYEVVERVCASRRDTIFVLVGEGRLKGEIAKWASRRGLSARVRILDPLGSELPALISCFDVALLTSYFEGLPNSLLEAQWYSVPVVAPDVGGVREAMEPGRSGFLVKRDCQKISDAIETLLQNKRLREKMQKAARKFASQKFSPSAALSILDQAYAVEPQRQRRRFIIQPRSAPK